MEAVPSGIGPYRIDGRLGAGGMGEVYRAWDGRLERRVAIKTIRPEAAEDPRVRERFRREARAAAGLSHPAIVQVYDILEWNGGEAIVMELVEGESLAGRIARGPLPLTEALRIGRDISQGLAAAHARGILHRDLKPENVMMTPEGSARILDFGLAKSFATATATSLTEGQVVLGTFRSMSPEQVRNLPLDHRSDLFSLGTLLYETLSGRSPFVGGSVLETLDRICNHCQEPLRKISPAVPEELSNLVDDLLRKDPMLRPRSAREVADRLEALAGVTPPSRTDEDTWGGERAAAWGVTPAAMPPAFSASYSVGRPKLRVALVFMLLASLAAFLLLLRGEPPKKQQAPAAPEPVYVAVPKPEVSGESEGVQVMAVGVRESLLQSLLSLEGLRPLAAEEVDSVKGSPREIARATAADEILSARLDCPGEICQISLSRVTGKDGRLMWTRTFSAAIDQPSTLPEAVQGYLREAYGKQVARADRVGPEARPEDYAAYFRLRQEYEVRKEGASPEQIFVRLAALRETSPRFREAYLFESDIRRQRYAEGRNPQELEKATFLLRRARELAPEDPRPLIAEFWLALLAGRLDAAEQVLLALEVLLPGDPQVLVCRGRLLEEKGKPEEGIQLLETAARRQPSWRILFLLAGAENRLGRFKAARGHLAQLLERYPGHYDALSLLAQIELLYGSAERAAETYLRMLRLYPGGTELSNLGFAYLLMGRYQEAERSFRRALELEPRSAFAHLNLADALALQGDRTAAAQAYRQVLRFTDSESDNWQILSIRAQALAHLGEGTAAVKAAQKVLRVAPENPQAAYEVSLVFLVLGDRASARFNALRALEGGVQPRLFALPFFDPLRSDPEVQALLKRRTAETSL
jgi:tetratricopeptide (TPR) repeat protein/tRNA A-37 threonylcarbamoyl transferase component Bud32